MAKWIVAVVAVVILAVGATAYVALSAAPAAPRAGCPAELSDTPYNSNAILYFDVASVRGDEFTHRFDDVEKSMLNSTYLDFADKTDLNPDRDIDHVVLSASFEDLSGSAVLAGRFDQTKITSYLTEHGSKKHYESGDIYTLQIQGPYNSVGLVGLTFLDPTRVALAAGPSAETQLLVISDAVKNPVPNLREDMCALAQRVSGAPFFAVGNVPEKASQELRELAASSSEPAAKAAEHVTGWDLATWRDGDTFRMSAEGQFDSRYSAFQALLAFTDFTKKAREALARRRMVSASPPLPSDFSAEVASALVDHFAFSLDGRYVRAGTWIKRADIERTMARYGIGPR